MRHKAWTIAKFYFDALPYVLPALGALAVFVVSIVPALTYG